MSVRRLSVLAAGALVVGCAAAPAISPPSSPSTPPAAPRLVAADVARTAAADPVAAGAAVAGFGTALLGEFPTDGNLVISPYSIYVALAMTRQGATGDVAAQLDALLGTSDAAATVTAVDAALAAVQPATSSNEMPAPVIEPANSLWVQDGAIRQPFLNRVGAGFGAGVYLTDYRADPEAARGAINGWVSEYTRTLIPELIPAGVISADTVLTLVNALYFAAEWGVHFTAAGEPLRFTTPSGTVVRAPAFAAVKSFASATGDGWRSVTIPYVGATTAMTLIVPDAGRFDAVQDELDADLIAAAVDGTPLPLEVTVPAFELDAASSLKGALQALGATAMFEWSRWPELNADIDLRVAEVVHQAVVDTDEKGTVAAAATAVVMESASAIGGQIEKLTVDRPFLFVIHDTTTNAPLFLGRVFDPTI